jgi:inositol monophosphatase 3
MLADVTRTRSSGKRALHAGGSGHKALLLLKGEAEAYIHTTKIKVLIKPCALVPLHLDVFAQVWDVCAGEALVRAAGGKFTDTRGAYATFVSPRLNDHIRAQETT